MRFACLTMSWEPKDALMLAQHNVIFNYPVTIMIIYVPYLLSRTNKLPGYA
jgi:hypothetical protein